MERMLMEYLVNSLWQAPLLAAGAWLLLRAGRPGPRLQHGVWVAALGLMVAMPLLSLRGMGADAVMAPVAAPAVAMPSTESAEALDASAVSPAIAVSKVGEGSARWSRMREFRLSAAATHRVVELYLAVILFAMVRLLWSWVVARRMVGDAAAAELGDVELALLGACCERLGVRRPRVMVSAQTSSPLVVGAVRPILLLPESFAGSGEHSLHELEAVWWHELAHVRRRDYLANLLCRIWALPVVYHPATYAVQGRVRQTREMVCDGMAAEEMESAAGYARCLVGLAQRMHAGELKGTAMFGDGVLEERVVELIGTKAVASVRVRVVRAACGVAMLTAVMGAAAMFHVTPTMAQSVVAGADRGVALLPATAVLPEVVLEAQESPRGMRVVRRGVVDRQQRLVRDVGPGPVGSISSDPVDAAENPALLRLVIRGQERAKREQLLAIADVDRMRLMAFMPGLRPQDVPLASAPMPEVTPVTPVVVVQPSPLPQLNVAGQPRPVTPVQPVAPLQSVAPIAPVAPIQPLAPVQPVAPIQHKAPLKPVAPDVPMEKVGPPAGRPLKSARGHELSEEELQSVEQDRSAADKDMKAAQAEIDEAKEGVREVEKRLNSPEFKKQMEDSQRAFAKMNSPEFRKQMEDGQRRVKEAMEKMNSPEFRKQMEHGQRQVRDAMEKMNSPEFRQKLADGQRAAAKINTPEFRKQMEEAQRQLKEAMEKMNSPEFRKQMQEMWAEPKQPDATVNH